jgi:hypothetical protein
LEQRADDPRTIRTRRREVMTWIRCRVLLEQFAECFRRHPRRDFTPADFEVFTHHAHGGLVEYLPRVRRLLRGAGLAVGSADQGGRA